MELTRVGPCVVNNIIFITLMVKVLANFSHPETYSSPEVKVVDIVSEGVLCASGLGFNDWERDDEALDFN